MASSKPYDPLRRAEAHAAFHTLFVDHSGSDRLRSLIPLIRISTAALYLPFTDDSGSVQLIIAGKVTTERQRMGETQERLFVGMKWDPHYLCCPSRSGTPRRSG